MTQLISVAAGLISVYIILALIVSHVGEWFSSLVNQRGKLLQRAIVALLAGREAAAKVTIPTASAHAAAAQAGAARAAVARRTVADAKAALGTAAAAAAAAPNDPALAQNAAAATAAYREAMQNDARDPTMLVSYLYAHPLIGNLGADGRLPSYIPNRTFTLSLVTAVKTFTGQIPPPADADPFTAGAADWNALRSDVAALPDGTLRSSLETLLDEAQHDYASALAAIDAWFEVQMDRIEGTYKRWATKIQVVIALVAVCLVNADTIGIANQLIQSSAVSTALTNAVQGARDQNISALKNDLFQAGLKIGWSPAPPNPFHDRNARTSSDIAFWLAKLGGLAITTFAALLGAPFWFDVLKQIMPVRMAGAKPVKNKAGAKGDKQATVMPQPRGAP